MRIAVLDKEKCKSKVCGFLCQKVCPRVRSGDETITIDDKSNFPIIIEELCVGCGICVNKCPFNAIFITNLPEETGTLTHQYGKNGFRLYGLPIPKEGSVVGIIGVNAIGKSTAIRILSGILKPNLGSLEEDMGWDAIVENYRGNEVQNYLESLKDKKIKTVYKPQYVDSISKAKKGKVKAVIESIVSNDGWNSNRLDESIHKLELESSLNKDVETLSGGELQRLAILVALIRDADVYFFDEPTSYLDIRQRLKVAKIIRDLAAQGKSVIVVEHDLIILDYLSDYVHIAYGKKSAFGIVSQLKNTRVGINEYLAGFLSSENVRFRSEHIKFEEKGLTSLKGSDVLCEYPKVTKHYPGFELNVDSGRIYRGLVLGALGPNAIGKTTFMKVIAGVESNDAKDKIDADLKISYKPQYLKVLKGTVNDILKSVTKDLYKPHYKRELLMPFELDGILDAELEKLSGGELQRVAIAECLSRDVDIYLLDEPSAFLDIEQRLITAKVIRRKMENDKKSAVVIDHDIAFVDYISDNIIVFSGEPGIKGYGNTPTDLRGGMNSFLKGMDITFRRDGESKRPRANKLDSQKDREQKLKGEYYYLGV